MAGYSILQFSQGKSALGAHLLIDYSMLQPLTSFKGRSVSWRRSLITYFMSQTLFSDLENTSFVETFCVLSMLLYVHRDHKDY